MDASEREQYTAAIQGDREAFEMIIRTNSRALFGVAWSLCMIGVVMAFLAPWAIAIFAVVWATKRIARARRR
jgi:hypothetical protein